MLSVLSYHQKSTDYFKKQNKTWQFFANSQHREDQLKDFKTELLKNTYKFDEATEIELYKKVSFAKEKLGLTLPVIIYQAQHTEEVNASIVSVNNEAHIVFSGKIIQLLSDEELLAVISHELSHIQLYSQLDGEVEVADRIINAIGNHQGSTTAHYETARLFKLYTEIFCDRGAYLVTGSYESIICSLVKIATGLTSVNPDSYIKQAEEIFAVDSATKTTGISHPENFIRARAIWLWHNKKEEAESTIRKMIEGNISIEELDLFGQQHIAELTMDLVRLILSPSWMQTENTLALAHQYFNGLVLDKLPDKKELSEKINNLHTSLKDYLSYVLYDFATNDPSLEDVPMGFCFFLADTLMLEKPFSDIVKKEKKLTEKKVSSLKKKTMAEYELQPSSF